MNKEGSMVMMNVEMDVRTEAVPAAQKEEDPPSHPTEEDLLNPPAGGGLLNPLPTEEDPMSHPADHPLPQAGDDLPIVLPAAAAQVLHVAVPAIPDSSVMPADNLPAVPEGPAMAAAAQTTAKEQIIEPPRGLYYLFCLKLLLWLL
jgi:hypothetical protein